MDKVLWNGNNLPRVPDWISEALNKYDYNTPGYLFRMNNQPTGSVIKIGTLQGEKTCNPGDYLVQLEDGSLDVERSKMSVTELQELKDLLQIALSCGICTVTADRSILRNSRDLVDTFIKERTS